MGIFGFSYPMRHEIFDMKLVMKYHKYFVGGYKPDNMMYWLYCSETRWFGFHHPFHGIHLKDWKGYDYNYSGTTKEQRQRNHHDAYLSWIKAGCPRWWLDRRPTGGYSKRDLEVADREERANCLWCKNRKRCYFHDMTDVEVWHRSAWPNIPSELWKTHWTLK